MFIKPIDKNINFGYHTFIKDCFMAGKLPTVKRGAYGFRINNKNVSNEHIIPASKGGTLELGNILLADKYINNRRGADPIENFLTKDKLVEYLSQFMGVKVKHKGKIFDGDVYIQKVLDTVKEINLK